MIMEFVAVIIIAVVFLVLREFWTWYLKLNTLVKQNDDIIKLLRKIANEPDTKSASEKAGAKLGEMIKK